MAQKYLFIAILCVKMSCVNKALSLHAKPVKFKKFLQPRIWCLSKGKKDIFIRNEMKKSLKSMVENVIQDWLIGHGKTASTF